METHHYNIILHLIVILVYLESSRFMTFSGAVCVVEFVAVITAMPYKIKEYWLKTTAMPYIDDGPLKEVLKRGLITEL